MPRPLASVLLLPGLLACGRFGFEERELGAAPDASTESTQGVSCWESWTSGSLVVEAPRRIAELATGDKHSNPSISADGLTLFFQRDDGDEDLYMASRATPAAPWAGITRLDELATTDDEGRLSTSADGTFAVFSSRRSGNMDLWTAQRPARDARFDPPTQSFVLGLSTSRSELDAEVTADGLRLYYAPYQSGEQYIAVARREPGGVFTLARVFEELQLSVAVSDPALSPDERVIAFSSGAVGAENDLYYAVRGSRDDVFDPPRPIPSVNLTPDINDGDIDVSSDGCEIYFMSDRGGQPDLYVARVAQYLPSTLP